MSLAALAVRGEQRGKPFVHLLCRHCASDEAFGYIIPSSKQIWDHLIGHDGSVDACPTLKAVMADMGEYHS